MKRYFTPSSPAKFCLFILLPWPGFHISFGRRKKKRKYGYLHFFSFQGNLGKGGGGGWGADSFNMWNCAGDGLNSTSPTTAILSQTVDMHNWNLLFLKRSIYRSSSNPSFFILRSEWVALLQKYTWTNIFKMYFFKKKNPVHFPHSFFA